MSLITTRAAVLDEPGKPMTVRDVQLREPGHGEVLIRTTCVGLCGTDLHFARGLFPYPVPTVLGHEASGTVEQAGPGVTGLQPGDRVSVCDQMPCGQCGPCLSGKMVYCTDTAAKIRQRDRMYLDGKPARQYLGVSALAELMLVDASGVIPVPAELTFEAAALLGCCLTTGAAAIFNTAALRPGQAALVIGCGGVGLGAIQAARIAGAATIIAVDPEPHRRRAASSLGATSTIDPEGHDLLKAIRNASGTSGIDIAVEAVGDPALAAVAFTALAPAGKAVIIGMMPPGSQIPVPASLLRHGRSLAGSVMGEVRSRYDIPVYQQLVTSGQMRADELATSRWPLEDVNTAFSHATARNGIRTMIEF